MNCIFFPSAKHSGYGFSLGFLLLLLAIATHCPAQKMIIISDSLEANAEMLKVKLGGQKFGKLLGVRFGDYAITSSKLGWSIGRENANLLKTRTEDESGQRFSFVLVGKTADSVWVSAENKARFKARRPFELFPGFFVGNDEVLEETNSFYAFISTNREPSQTWVLFINSSIGSQVENTSVAKLSDGKRNISLMLVSSIVPDGRKHTGFDVPAMGYEFKEGGQSIGAVQFFGGGMLGLDRMYIWLHKNADPETKLVLAGATTAIIESFMSRL